MAKISNVDLFGVPPRWLFLKLTTDDGLVGWGEPIVEAHADTVRMAVKEVEEYLVSRDPNHIEDIWQVLYRGSFYRGGAVMMSAIAGIDQALWDLKGKRYGLPIYDFLGGRARDKIRIYSWIGGDRPSLVGAEAKKRQNDGFTAIKMNASEEMHYIDSYDKVEAVVERVATVREAVGKNYGIAVDFHGRIHKPMAKVLARELDPFHLLFIEEPVLPENNDALREIARFTTTPIATGERLYSRWDFRRLLQDGYVDIIQPDLSHAGGISEVKKIAAMAEAYDVALAPHCPLGPISLAACLQLDVCTPNVFIQEQSLGIHYNQHNDLKDYVDNPEAFTYSSGFVELPHGPGLGIEINELRVRSASQLGHTWKNPLWRNEDGTIAEW